MSAPSLEIRLALRRPDFLLSIELELPAQGISVLFGPSGSGKTSVLRCVAGLERAQGQVVIDGEVWQDSERGYFRPTWQRELGYVFQEASLFAHLSVKANLEFGIKRSNQRGGAQALTEALDLLGIEHLMARNPASLSGGERQRVAIARALAMQPRLLLLDEPLASLDGAKRQEIMPWLERLHKQLRIPVLYVTHSMAELVRLADHVVLLQAGRLKLHGPIAAVLADAQFAKTVGGQAGAILQGRLVEHDSAFGLSAIETQGERLWVRQVDLAPGAAVRVHVNANDVSLSTVPPVASSIQNQLSGRITAIHDDVHPSSQIVVLAHGEQQVLSRVTRKACHALGLKPGMQVWAQIKSVALTEP